MSRGKCGQRLPLDIWEIKSLYLSDKLPQNPAFVPILLINLEKEDRIYMNDKVTDRTALT